MKATLFLTIVAPIFGYTAFYASNALAEAAPELEEPSRSMIEWHLNDAYDALTSAGTYICKDRTAQQKYSPVWEDFLRMMKEAENLLGRRPNTDIYLNSCRKHVNWAKFDRDLRKARIALRRSQKLIKAGDTR